MMLKGNMPVITILDKFEYQVEARSLEKELIRKHKNTLFNKQDTKGTLY